MDRKRPKNEKIISGVAKKQKKPFGKRMAEIFFEDDTKSVGSYIMHDVLIPAAKAMLSDMVGGGLDMMLFGERRRGGSSIRRDGNRSVVNYNSMSNSSYGRDRNTISQNRQPARVRNGYEEIILDNHGDADDVLDRLIDQVETYGMVSVADLYDMVGMDSNFTDDKWGWTDLRAATVNRIRDGYLINLPRPQPLN